MVRVVETEAFMLHRLTDVSSMLSLGARKSGWFAFWICQFRKQCQSLDSFTFTKCFVIYGNNLNTVDSLLW